MREGQGSAYNQDGSLKYSGTWKQGHPHGIGTAYFRLYDTNTKLFTSGSVHGSFRDGVYVGPPDERRENGLSDSTSQKNNIENVLFGYAKTISTSFYQLINTFVTNILHTISHYLMSN